MLTHVFGLFFRVLVVLLAMLATSHLVGKKFDILAGIAVGSIAALFMLDRTISVADGLTIMISFGVLTWVIKFLAVKFPGTRPFVEGTPTILIEQGKVLEKNMKKANLNIPNLLASLRTKGAFNLSDVEFAVLETDGQVNLMKRSELNPVTPKLEGTLVEAEHAPQIVMMDGLIQQQPLMDAGYSPGWLLAELQKQGVNHLKDVFLAQLDSQGNLYVDLNNDVIKRPKISAKPLLLSSLKKNAADLEMYSLSTENATVKQMYSEQSQNLLAIIAEVQSYLRS